MDRGRKDDLVALVDRLAERGAAVLIATHDVEFAAEFADRVVLLGDGVVIADGPSADILSGGWYFATEVARVLDVPGVVTPEHGAALLAEAAGAMSWQLVSFLILAAVLLGGFAWYERSRPPAQVVALVAALAALAIAGRIAFAAFPNVKPTTDIVIFAGYALGPAAGFAVGALAALVSNFWFGQGPWTPWQMAAWGLCGILGAALALGTRNVGRLTLAAVCGLAAVGYGAILNFSLIATYGGELSWQRFWIFEGRAVPFEIAHAAGNIAFALVAGPAMVRMLIRFRERFEWSRAEVGAAGPATVALGRCRPAASPSSSPPSSCSAPSAPPTPGPPPRPAPPPRPPGSNRCRTRTAAGRESKGSGSEPADDRLGDARARGGGDQPAGRHHRRRLAGRLPADADRHRSRAPATSPARSSRSRGPGSNRANSPAATWSRRCWRSGARTAPTTAGRTRPPTRCWRCARPASPTSPTRSNGCARRRTKTAAGATSSARRATPTGPARCCRRCRRPRRPRSAGVGYLRQVQQQGGGFRLGGNGALNTQSTSRAIQGLLAAGANPADFKRGGKSAYDYIEENQAGDGHYRYSSKSDQTPIWVTGDVLVAAAKQHLPLAAVPRAPQAEAGHPGSDVRPSRK